MERAQREGKRIMGIQGTFKWVLVLAGLLGSLSSRGASGDGGSGLFEEGNKFYEQRKYSDAVSAYEKAIQSGQSNGPVFSTWETHFTKRDSRANPSLPTERRKRPSRAIRVCATICSL